METEYRKNTPGVRQAQPERLAVVFESDCGYVEKLLQTLLDARHKLNRQNGLKICAIGFVTERQTQEIAAMLAKQKTIPQ